LKMMALHFKDNMTVNIKLDGKSLESKFPYEYSSIDKLALGKRDVVVVRTTLPPNLQRAKQIKYMKSIKERVKMCLKEVGITNPVMVIDGNNTSLQVMTPEEIFAEKL